MNLFISFYKISIYTCYANVIKISVFSDPAIIMDLIILYLYIVNDVNIPDCLFWSWNEPFIEEQILLKAL
jgi:hypothetical protein